MAEYHIEPLSYRSKVRATWENVIIVRSLKRDVLRENVESFMCPINGLHWHVCIWLLSLFESIAAAKKNQRGSCFVSKINLSIRKSSSMWLKQNHLHMCMQTHDFSWRWRLMVFGMFSKVCRRLCLEWRWKSRPWDYETPAPVFFYYKTIS